METKAKAFVENRNNEAVVHYFGTRLCDCPIRAMNQSFTTGESSVEVETKAYCTKGLDPHGARIGP